MSKNNFQIIGDEIHITNPNWSKIAFTTYREDYYDELASKTWTLRKDGYIYNHSLGLLHHFIIKQWYGKEFFDDMTQKEYIIEHMNNNHSDCRISNLEFLKKSYNTAKGQTYDIDSNALRRHIALDMFKDFSTGFYQITIGCNDDIILLTKDGERKHLCVIKLLYDCDYFIVVLEAEKIIREYETEKRINLSTTSACDIKYISSDLIIPTEESVKNGYYSIDGKLTFLLGTGNSYIDSVGYDKGWKPPKNINSK